MKRSLLVTTLIICILTMTIGMVPVIPVNAEDIQETPIYTELDIPGYVVYAKDGGTGDGTAPDNALGTLKDAIAALSDTGGTIVVCGPLTHSAWILASPNSQLIKVTSVYDGVNYAEGENQACVIVTGDANAGFRGDFLFDNITISYTGSSSERYWAFDGHTRKIYRRS